MRRLLQQHQWIRHADDHDDLIMIIAVTIAWQKVVALFIKQKNLFRDNGATLI
jgi:hypothetical protein